MRNNVFRAVLRRFILRLSVVAAFGLVFAALLTPGTWLGGDATLLRVGMGGLAFGLVAFPLGFSLGRKPRPRVTAPRAAAGLSQA
jgi:hypothetical protein